MNIRLAPLLLVFAAALSPAPLYAGELLHLAPPRQSPPLALADLAGRQHDLADYRGQVVLVNFWASWCRPCLQEMPGMQRLQDAMAGRPFRLLAVNVTESKATVWRFRKLLNIDFTLLLDSEGTTASAWQVDVYPTSFLIGPDGQVRYAVQGSLEWDADPAVKVIESLLPADPAGIRSAAWSRPGPVSWR